MPDINEIIHWLQSIGDILPWLVVGLAAVAATGCIVVLVLNLLDCKRLYGRRVVLFEATPPANVSKTPEATKKFFANLHGLNANRSIIDKLLRHKAVFSTEIVATREQGIRYILRVAEDETAIFEQAVESFLSETRIRRIDDYVPEYLDHKKVKIIEVRQKGHFAYPLNTQLSLAEHDPMAYLTGTMTKLHTGELMALQMVVSPMQSRQAAILSRKLLHNEELIYKLGGRRVPVLDWALNAVNATGDSLIDAVGEMTSGIPSHSSSAHATHKQQVAAKVKPARILGALEQKLIDPVHDKLTQQLFRVNIRALVIVDDPVEAKQRTCSIRDWFSSFDVPRYQALRARFNFPAVLRGRYRIFALRHRVPSVLTRNTCILSAAEMADLYHFPDNTTTKTENVVKSLSKTLPATLSLKNGTKLDVVLGKNYHQGISTDVGLTVAERERHMFVVGGTGNGKTTLLKYSIVQDIRNGKGVAVIDPHGDLAQELLEHIPKERINDVIYFNPADIAYPIGMNLLELPKGLTDDELVVAKDFIAEMVVSIMRKTFSDDGTGGHRIEYVLRNAVLTALTVEDATLFTVYDLLTNSKFRKPIVKKLEQEWLRNFWNNEYGKAGDYQQVKMVSGVTSKIGRYHASAAAERTLEQPKSTINFSDVLDGKILICNLSKGSIGEDTTEVLGVSILAQLQLASYRRINQKRSERRPFFAYVDEFQNFATTSFAEMLSESRKYKLFLIMAEQTTSQQDDDKMVNTILTNAGTIVCFRSNGIDDERRMLHLFNDKISPGEIANLPAYNFYAKLGGGTDPQDPISGITVVLDQDGDEKTAKKVTTASRKNYAKKYATKKAQNMQSRDNNSRQNENKDDGNSLMTNSEM